MVDFAFGQVEAVLAAMNRVASHKRIAFAGRLKFLQRNGVPLRVKPGRGRAGAYSFAQLMQLAIAVELLQSGLSPQRAAQLVQQNWGRLRNMAMHHVSQEFEQTAVLPTYVWMVNLE